MKSSLQFLTTPTADTPGTTLLLRFDNKKYLFGNLAEGTQRASIQQRAKLFKVSDIFISGKTEWRNNGGLLGTMLTLADAVAASVAHSTEEARKKAIANIRKRNGNAEDEDAVQKELEPLLQEARSGMTIFGTRNLNYTLATARRFIFRKGMPIDVREVREDSSGNSADPEPIFSDVNIKVWAMAVNPHNAQDAVSPTNGTKSPRKRSFEEMHGLDSNFSSEDEGITLKAKEIVHEMFDSTWRMDALFETQLDQVKMPAALFVRNPHTNKLEKYQGPMPSQDAQVANTKVLVRKPWPGALVKTLPPTVPATEAVSYIIKNRPRRGKFMVAQAKALGLNDPRKYSKLTKGESLQNDKGETITAEMVLEPDRPGLGAAILDIPSLDYVEPLLNRQEWHSQQVMDGIEVFIWLLGPGVSNSPLLKPFMEQRRQWIHIVSSSELCSNRYANDSAAAATIRMSKLDPARFIVPVHNNQGQGAPGVLPDFIHVADRGQVMDLAPVVELKTDEVSPAVDAGAVVSEMSPQVLQLADMAHDDIEKDAEYLTSWADRLPRKDAEITTLGTGSALPSKYRNVSATLVRVPGWGSMLLDCGESTLGQLKRVYEKEELAGILQDLRLIWISHMHADHHLGTVSVIRAWYDTVHKSQAAAPLDPAAATFDAAKQFVDQKRLAIISDRPMLHWLREYSQVEDYGFSRIAPLCITPDTPHRHSRLKWFIPPPPDTEEQDAETESRISSTSLGLEDIRAVPVQHCSGARAVSITWPPAADETDKQPFKVSYSGDCRPSDAFVAIGRGSTVCIHEATFDDELKGDAQAKNHSTTSEALDVASRMHAKSVVLTHFSQRYQKIPVLEYTDEERGRSRSSSPERLAMPGNGVTGATNADTYPTEMETDEPLLDPSSTSTTTTASTSNQQQQNQTSQRSQSQSQSRQRTFKLDSKSDMKICIAFDYMRVKVGEIAQMEKFTPALLALFADEDSADVDLGGDEHGVVNGAAAQGKNGAHKHKGGKEQGKSEKKKEKEKVKGRRNN